MSLFISRKFDLLKQSSEQYSAWDGCEFSLRDLAIYELMKEIMSEYKSETHQMEPSSYFGEDVNTLAIQDMADVDYKNHKLREYEVIIPNGEECLGGITIDDENGDSHIFFLTVDYKHLIYGNPHGSDEKYDIDRNSTELKLLSLRFNSQCGKKLNIDLDTVIRLIKHCMIYQVGITVSIYPKQYSYSELVLRGWTDQQILSAGNVRRGDTSSYSLDNYYHDDDEEFKSRLVQYMLVDIPKAHNLERKWGINNHD